MIETKDRIIQEVFILFTTYGVKSITMDDIAGKLGISKKTIYQYYKNKKELVLESTRFHIESETKLLEPIFSSDKDPVTQITELFTCLKLSADRFNPAIVFDIKKSYPQSWQMYQQFKSNTIEGLIKKNLLQGVTEGYYRPDIKLELMVALKLAQMDIAFDNVSFNIPGMNAFQVAIELFDHFIRGIVTEKGLTIYLSYKTQNNYN